MYRRVGPVGVGVGVGVGVVECGLKRASLMDVVVVVTVQLICKCESFVIKGRWVFISINCSFLLITVLSNCDGPQLNVLYITALDCYNAEMDVCYIYVYRVKVVSVYCQLSSCV